MTEKKSFWDSTLLHPFLFTVFALLALWNANITEIPAYAISRAAFLALIFLLLGMLVGRLLFRDRAKAAVFASLFLLLFLTYGHFFTFVDEKTIAGFNIGRHRYILMLWAGLLAAGGLLIWRLRRSPVGLNRILNMMCAFLVISAGIQIVLFALRPGGAAAQAGAPAGEGKAAAPAAAVAAPGAAVTAPGADKPDVYYILLDGYARADMLSARGGPDISPFLDALTGMGFSVANCALANYDHTPISMAAALNMNYLDALNVTMHPERASINGKELEGLLKRSLVRRTFEQMGYQTVTFKGTYEWLNTPDTTYYYDAEAALPFYDRLETVNFQYMFLSTTLFRPLMDAQGDTSRRFEKLPMFLLQIFYPKASTLTSREYKQYQQSLYSLEKLREAPALPGKKFVYAHLFVTHQPYVFNPDGSFRKSEEDSETDYFAQIEYINRVLPEILQTIIQKSDVPPVIILQADHGYVDTPERARILNAYYLPGDGAKGLNPGITPVNSFRYVLSRYFGADTPLLEDKAYHSERTSQYQIHPIEPSCPEGGK